MDSYSTLSQYLPPAMYHSLWDWFTDPQAPLEGMLRGEQGVPRSPDFGTMPPYIVQVSETVSLIAARPIQLYC